MHLLTFTSLYPSAARPRHGIFVESRLQRLVRRGIRGTVVAPVPWFPFDGERWGEYGRISATPRREVRGGIEVLHPRYASLPGLDCGLKPRAMAASGMKEVEALMSRGVPIDLVDGHYLYPDGVAAAEIAARLNKPLVLSARGSDVNVVAQYAAPRRRILRAIDYASAVITVSAALKASLVLLGVTADRISVLRNGVDLDLFFPEERDAARAQLGLPIGNAPAIASVGNLVPGKRHDLVLEAAEEISGIRVVIVGRGPERSRLERMARNHRLAGRVFFLDEMTQDRLRTLYSAVNAIVLASEREGWPNVILESAACGTPVVAFPVGGVPEILADMALGTMVSGDASSNTLARSIRMLLRDPPPSSLVRAAAARFSWDSVIDEQLKVYRGAAGLLQTSDEVAGIPA